jgi:hypothetical protein
MGSSLLLYPKFFEGLLSRKRQRCPFIDFIKVGGTKNIAERIGYGRNLEHTWLESGWRKEKVVLG